MKQSLGAFFVYNFMNCNFFNNKIFEIFVMFTKTEIHLFSLLKNETCGSNQTTTFEDILRTSK